MRKTKIREAYLDAVIDDLQHKASLTFYSEEAVEEFKGYFLNEGLIILDVSGKEEPELSTIIWYNFYRWDLYHGNPFMYQDMFH